MKQKPKINILVRDLSIYSEVWLQRQLKYPFVDNIICTSQPKEKSTDFEKQVYYLYNPYNIISRIVSKMGNFSSSWVQKKKLRSLKSILKEGDILVIHYIEVALKWKKLIESGKYKVFIYCHGYGMFEDMRKHTYPDKRQHPHSYKEALHEVSKYCRFITNSLYSANRLKELGISVKKIDLNYYGVQADQATTVYDETNFNILFVGRLVDFKGVDRTISAFELAMDKGLNGNLTIIGDGPMKVTIEMQRQRSRYKDKIHILGIKSSQEVRETMLSSQIFTAHNSMGELSRQEEAFGVTMIEAMNLGLPIVATRSGGIVDSVVNGETGLLIEPFDVAAQAEAFINLKKNKELWNRLSAGGKKRIKEKFTQDIAIENLQKILLAQNQV